MEYYGHRLCISSADLMEGVGVNRESYHKLCQRGELDVVRRAGGPGRYALVAVDSLPRRIREKVESVYPRDSHEKVRQWVCSNYEVDQEAVAFYHDRSRTGMDLTEEHIREYVTNASVLNTCIRLYDKASVWAKLFGEKKYDWKRMADAIEALRKTFGHTLPSSIMRFRKKVNEYKRDGYASLISGKFGNQNTRKVTLQVERVVAGLAVMPNKPWNTSVCEMYNMFVTGELDVYDPVTGELMNPDEFVDKKTGDPLSLSESTIANILNNPRIKMLVADRLDSSIAFLHEQAPHVHRHSGDWSLSQVTMDDVDLTRKLKDTKRRVHAYYAYDVVSQCVIGASYGRKKDQGLVVACFRDMFRMIARMGWGMPAGIEVENHLMTDYKEGLLKAGEVFRFVHFCAPQNSQEKYAEQMNGAKKRTVIHKNHEGIGRFYGKGKWRTESQKVSDEENDTWEDKSYYAWDDLVADDRRDNDEWNHALHPNQKKFPGMTRWDVLTQRVNPTLKPLDKVTVARYVGEKVDTSIRRNSTVRVCGEDWWLDKPETLAQLQGGSKKVTAYYMPTEDGGTGEDVYLFQGNHYLCRLEKVVTYSRVMAEQTEEDKRAMEEQMKKLSKWKAYVKDNRIERLGISKVEDPEPVVEAEPLPVIREEETHMASDTDDDDEMWAMNALDDF